MEAKERKDKQKLRVLRAKERQLLLKEVETLRSKAKKLNKENKDEVKIDEDIKIQSDGKEDMSTTLKVVANTRL